MTGDAPHPARPAPRAGFCGAVFLLALLAPPAPAQDISRAERISTAEWEPPAAREHPFPLTVASVMRGPELVGKAPQAVAWTDDASAVYFEWLPGGEPWHEERDLWRVGVGDVGAGPERVAEDADAPPEERALFARGDLSPDGRWRVSAVDGDLWLVERDDLRVQRLTETRETELSPSFDAAGERVFFRRGTNLFALHLGSGTLRQLTDIREPAGEDEEEDEGQRAFLEEQQEELFERIRTERELREEREERARERAEARPDSLMLERGWRVRGIEPNRPGTHAVLTLARPAEEAEEVIVPEWVTESGYTGSLETRPKVGDVQGAGRIGILELATGAVEWLEFPAPDDDPEEARAEEGGVAGDPAPVEEVEPIRASLVGWNDEGTVALVSAWSNDHENSWLYAVRASDGGAADGDAADGEWTELAHLTDEAWHAWRGGPCTGCVGWVPGEDRAFYVDEESGYAHLYTVRADGTDRRRLTAGEWELRGVEVLPDDSGFLLHSAEESPFDTHAYTMGFDGGERTRLTRGEGRFRATPSPDGERLAVVRSGANRPPELYLTALRAGAGMERVTRSPTEEWLAFDWIRPEIVRFTARDGARVPARIYRPPDLGAEPNGAAVVFVHGAGYLHNVHHGWSSYEREYMFHHLLAASGYTVLDIDYRGSAGYGRDWRTGIYRWMGGRDLSDQVDGVRWLVENEGVDAERVGIYGGSYGGFITLMALFTEPDVFAAGAALRSVTDWAHYNHRYTSRILNLPQDDPEAYRRSSPIYFAEGLEGHLLIAHGMVDVNVHFSDVVRLAQRLIELGKEDWEMAVYPAEDHAFVDPASWTDEYRRIFELFERVIGPGVESPVVDVRGVGGPPHP